MEFNFAGLPSGADDRYFYGAKRQNLGQLGTQLNLTDSRELHLVDQWLGIDVGLEFSRPSAIWTYPIETVSQSEGGFELVHQSVCVQPHWHIQGDADGRWSVAMQLTLDTSVAEQRHAEVAGKGDRRDSRLAADGGLARASQSTGGVKSVCPNATSARIGASQWISNCRRLSATLGSLSGGVARLSTMPATVSPPWNAAGRNQRLQRLIDDANLVSRHNQRADSRNRGPDRPRIRESLIGLINPPAPSISRKSERSRQ